MCVWGGVTVQLVHTSAVSGMGLADLKEALLLHHHCILPPLDLPSALLPFHQAEMMEPHSHTRPPSPPRPQAEMMELQAPPAGPAAAVVVEARLDRGAGALATVVVKVWVD